MKLQYFSYNLPFSNPFLISGQKYHHRKGVVLKCLKNGISAWGEAAPLPGFSSETREEVISRLREIKRPIIQLFDSITSMQEACDFFTEHELSPALQFCIFTVCSTLLAQKKELSLHQFLFSDSADRIPVNAVIDLSGQNILSKVDMFKGRGFKTIKIKAGSNGERVIEQLTIICSHHPKINLRIDANQSWSLDQAINIFQKIAPLNIEYCEEPLANPDPNTLTALRNNTTIPIALDESISKSFTLKQASRLTDVIIVKPMVLGIRSIAEISKPEGQNNHPDIIFTTSLESSIGRLMTATLAAGRGSKTKAHGLATGQFLSSDIWDDEQFISNGFYNLPDAETLQALMNTTPENLMPEALDL